jgi:predicted lysophospholipase L1 biosynthesis ABC-type transport system permease subunit
MEMEKSNEPLETLSEIRSLMERSSRFISLSGLSGVFAGIFALMGAIAAYLYLNISISTPEYYQYAFDKSGAINLGFYIFFFTDASCVLVLSLAVGSILTIRKAKLKRQPIWDVTAKRLLINLMIPLIVGGLFCMALLYHGLIGLIAPATLIFYGLALFNASKYTLDDIRYLAICEIILGLIGSIFIGYGLLFWAVGFGILHIIYGIIMYNKYEKLH